MSISVNSVNSTSSRLGQVSLTEEQERLIALALQGKNVLVDACIGSGKTTTIQELCNRLSREKKVLYLTYNRLLKLDAKRKIHRSNVTVTNYHGFAYQELRKLSLSVGPSELLRAFVHIRPEIPKYDVLIIDEYQDIDQEIVEELLYIKEQCPGIQIIAVGDLMQKIYDFTTLDNVSGFIEDYLDHPVQLSFTYCFRLSRQYADILGRLWGKEIHGVNENFHLQKMDLKQVTSYLGTKDPGQVLCLGGNGNGVRSRLQNRLEKQYPKVYNKRTLWSSVTAQGDERRDLPEDCAIFTTYDKSKGMERPILVVCDFDRSYWTMRSKQPLTKFEVLRNIFLVAISRGKNEIVFVTDSIGDKNPLLISDLTTPFESKLPFQKPMNISQAFDYKYEEDVQDCFQLLQREEIHPAGALVPAKLTDGLIDLSMCVGTYVEAAYFKNFELESQMKFLRQFSDRRLSLGRKDLQKDILTLTAMDTGQMRYVNQVACPYIQKETIAGVHRRLSPIFSRDEMEQVDCEIDFRSNDGKQILPLIGRCDVLKDDAVFELKFTTTLQHTHFLQLACYMIGLGLETGYLYNIRTGEAWRVTIPDRRAFLDQVARTITKRVLDKYHAPLFDNPLTVPPKKEHLSKNVRQWANGAMPEGKKNRRGKGKIRPRTKGRRKN